MLLIVAGASGVGKSTLGRRLREEFAKFRLSVSYTTRAPRSGEVDGVDYHFVDRPTFDEMVAADEFAEYATVHGNCYGTARATIDTMLREGLSLVFDIDVQGTRLLDIRYPDAVKVMVLPPSMSELDARLRGRATDTAEVIERRLDAARYEIEQHEIFDYLIVNDDFDLAYDTLRAIVVAEHARHRRMARTVTALLKAD